MRKRLISLAIAMTLCGPTLAANVGLYGSLDYGLLYDRTELGGDSGLVQRSNSLRLDSGLTNRSYVGLRGEEDLNAEWRVRFRLEGGFSGDSGELDDGGRLLSRESTLTVSGPYGDLSVGRTGTLSSTVGTYGLFGNYAQPFGETSQVLEAADWSFGGYSADNMITYASPSVGGVRAYAQYSFGLEDDAARSRNKTRYLSAGLTLDRGPVSAMAAAERWLNPRFITETGGKLPGVGDGTVLMLGGSYDLGVVKPYLSYEHSWDAPYPMPLGETDLTTNSVYAVTGYRLSAGFSAPFGNHTFRALAHYNSFEFDAAGLNRFGESDRSLTYCERSRGIAVGYDWQVSKRTALYTNAGLLKIDYSGQDAPVHAESKVYQLGAGVRHNF